MFNDKRMDTPIVYWLTDDEQEKIFSSRYWNREEEEAKKKQWYVLDGDLEQMIKFLDKDRKYFAEYESIVNFAAGRGAAIHGVGIDMAAGTGWATALLSKIEAVEKIYALDISRHRLLKIAPIVFNHFGANLQKISRVIGSFTDIKLPDDSIDFCFMSSAFHHAADPDKLLAEAHRVLKPGGVVLCMGEKPISVASQISKMAKNVIKMIAPWIAKTKAIYKLFPDFVELYPPDLSDGEHYYRIRDYQKIFTRRGFDLFCNCQPDFINFMAIKR